jgi:hypothetical protein
MEASQDRAGEPAAEQATPGPMPHRSIAQAGTPEPDSVGERMDFAAKDFAAEDFAVAAGSAGGPALAGRGGRAPAPHHPRLRAAGDLLLALAVTALPLLLLADPYEALLVALVLGSIGIVWFVARRERDMARRSAEDQWREAALDGRGVSLAAWHAGASPAPRAKH